MLVQDDLSIKDKMAGPSMCPLLRGSNVYSTQWGGGGGGGGGDTESLFILWTSSEISQKLSLRE